MFSSRLPHDPRPNPLTRALRALRADDVPIFDLTESNPTRVGLDYPERLFDELVPSSRGYAPAPLGVWSARAAVAAHLETEAIDVAPDRIALTASTSEAYSILFKLLCDPGHEILVPQPSYPLFAHLTRLDGVVGVPYDLEYHGRWSIDPGRMARAVSPRTRAILVVTPNNPTGSYLSQLELEQVSELAAAHDLALIGDEVFRSYPASDAAPPWPSVLSGGAPMAFSLGGLSKSVGLPQMKLAWIAVGGHDAEVSSAMARLELACDTYLSVATSVQGAVGALFAGGQDVHEQIAMRVRRNLDALQRAATDARWARVLPVEGGWSAVVEVPATVSEEERVLDLLTRRHVLVHPGFFYDFPREAFLVCSLLPEPRVFDAALPHLLARD
ncbi:MAG: pyridoxal phosphate-dependent aminotransferase [Vicinamibacterales bacterium]|jgi:hypothetical protein|nr:aspartate aminotransferase [Acidobacteriota bacterium]MDP7295666.1 pyridoxal phosphate-dependent aminotransferase [Vicinamibacterales bacterium]MDP7472147.1 pyridoxal phosphate-dependent aminotransferase [Vicinamibacterales bacterium]MDP7670819.1 pyridoxal phosphate-dependent aminotransferase [Vicinamibacterales bacterium]HJO37826.1 pyridoxal phosphate-dependent aminotransferase [Vicinamibacterales bacterium]|tara:strand:- start:1078 stop:2235 length:1158 start_codon:yes stop_codon:yes gene_type:complete